MHARGLAVILLATACSSPQRSDREPLGVLPTAVTSAEPQWIPFGLYAGRSAEADPRERRLVELRQLTTDGKSGGAVWHPDSRQIVYQTGRSESGCGELVRLHLASGKTARMAPREAFGAALGPGDRGEPRLLFGYAPGMTGGCPTFSAGLSWTLPECDIHEAELFVAERRGVGGEPALRAVVEGPGYDGDPAIARDGRIAFTSTRDGDPELYLASAGGEAVSRITRSPGYDGGVRFSPDGARLVWQSERGAAAASGARVAPRALEIVMAGSAGQHPRAITRHGAFSIMPSFLPDSRRLLYASDWDDPRRRDQRPKGAPSPYGGDEVGAAHDFEIYLFDPEAPPTVSGDPPLERITFHPGFDGEAALSPDGRYLLFTSSRLSSGGGTNVFVARWVDDE